MANPIRINASTLNRPGVFVTQASTGGLPQPIASHAVGYLFGTTPTEDYYGEDAVNAYSIYEPYNPTQVGSVAEYLEKIGGVIPDTNRGALASYDAVKAFFDNVGVNGILYFTRVSPIPETVIDIGVSGAGSGYNAFALKINGRYFGTPIGVNDPDGDPIRVITTTALDQADNARDLYAFLSTNGDGFTDFYRIEQDATEALAGQFRIFSRDTKNLPTVDRFVAYQFNDTNYSSPLNLNNQIVVKAFTSIKEMNFRCVSRDTNTGEPILFLSGSSLSAYLLEVSTAYTATAIGFNATDDEITLSSSVGLSNGDKVILQGSDIGTLSLDFNTVYYVVNKTGDVIQLANTLGGLTIDFSGAPGADVTVRKIAYDPAIQESDIVKAFLVDQKIYASAGDIPDDKIVAVSKDFTSGHPAPLKWADGDSAYWTYDLAGTSFSRVQSSGQDAVPSGTISVLGNTTVRSGYLPDSVQVFYINIAGENRAIIVNGATPDELAQGLVAEINKIFTEKELDGYYNVEVLATETNVSGDTHVPNNGHKVSLLTSEAGAPYIRPELADIALTGTVGISGGVVTGSETKFLTEIAPGDIIVVNGVRFTVVTVGSNTAATVLPNNVTVAPGAPATLDKSIPNGFFSFDYVLKVKITSNNGVSSPVNPGRNRLGVSDSNVVKLISVDQNPQYESYKLTAAAKAGDFVYAIEQGMDSKVLSPGFLFAPEAYTVLTYEVGSGDFASAFEARQERLKITQALTKAAEGKLGPTEGIVGTQHIALIDCGADEISLSKVQDELDLIKSTVGVPFGHAAYYAPYVKNLEDRFIAPSSYVAGIACSRYVNEGFQSPPAGARYPLRGAIGLKFDISAQQQEVTYALGLNPIRSLPNRGIVAWGARTLSPNPLFKFVNTRAILNVLVDVMGRSFDDILFEQIDSAGTVYARVKSIASQILGQFFRQGALFGSRPEQAYLVVCSSANNNANDLENGTVRLDVYVATSPTLERLLVTIVRTPAGQVAQLSDSFSRNEERFSALLDATTIS
jgi:sorbitol-specific phosphotransferase system component IIA